MTSADTIMWRHSSQDADSEALIEAISLPPDAVALVWHPRVGFRLMTPGDNGKNEEVPGEMLALTECYLRIVSDHEGLHDLTDAFLARSRGGA